jgi:hypothetical protein
MTPDKFAALASAALGVIGTIILFVSSPMLEPFAAAPLGSQELVERKEGIRSKNSARNLVAKIRICDLMRKFYCSGCVDTFLARIV